MCSWPRSRRRTHRLPGTESSTFGINGRNDPRQAMSRGAGEARTCSTDGSRIRAPRRTPKAHSPLARPRARQTDTGRRHAGALSSDSALLPLLPGVTLPAARERTSQRAPLPHAPHRRDPRDGDHGHTRQSPISWPFRPPLSLPHGHRSERPSAPGPCLCSWDDTDACQWQPPGLLEWQNDKE